MTLIKDDSGELPLSVNDTIAFQLSAPGENGEVVIGLVVLGINIVDGLEMFAENFEVESALVLDDKIVTIYDYYEEQRPELLSNLISADSAVSKLDGYTYSNTFPDLGYRVTSISLSRERSPRSIRSRLSIDLEIRLNETVVIKNTTNIIAPPTKLNAISFCRLERSKAEMISD